MSIKYEDLPYDIVWDEKIGFIELGAVDDLDLRITPLEVQLNPPSSAFPYQYLWVTMSIFGEEMQTDTSLFQEGNFFVSPKVFPKLPSKDGKIQWKGAALCINGNNAWKMLLEEIGTFKDNVKGYKKRISLHEALKFLTDSEKSELEEEKIKLTSRMLYACYENGKRAEEIFKIEVINISHSEDDDWDEEVKRHFWVSINEDD